MEILGSKGGLSYRIKVNTVVKIYASCVVYGSGRYHIKVSGFNLCFMKGLPIETEKKKAVFCA